MNNDTAAAAPQRQRGQKKFHPFELWSDHKDSPENWIELATEWIKDEATNDFNTCRNKDMKTLTCHCMSPFCDNERSCYALAEYMAHFINRPYADRQHELWLMVRAQGRRDSLDSAGNHCVYQLPFFAAPGDEGVVIALQDHYVCKNAVQHVLNVGRLRWSKIAASVKQGLPPSKHHLWGKESNRRKALEDGMVYDDLRFYFECIKVVGEPRATRFVREATGTTTLRDDKDTIDLPTYMTQRGLYKDFCWHRGVKVTSSNKGAITHMERDDRQWVDSGSAPSPCPSLPTFLSFWRREYANMRIRKPARDVCGLCYSFMINNKKRLLLQRKDTNVANDADGYNSASSSGSESGSTNNTNNNRLTPEQLEELEKDIIDTSTHVKDARAQREYVNELKNIAVQSNSAESDTPHSQRTYLFYFDYAQNVQCPQFGSEQPGETYYYSPLNINVFGIVDSNGDTEALTAYCFHEGHGAKGGDSVTSMLHYYLNRRGLLVGGGGHLVLVCDNCGGQNKNRMVIRYCVWLLETKSFSKVSLLFLVAGHTKNPCDRSFNLLKKEYHRTNIFDVDDLVRVLDSHPLVSAEYAPDFREWDKYLDQLYQRPKSIKKWHCFELISDIEADGQSASRTTIRTRRSNDTDDAESYDISRRDIQGQERQQLLNKLPEMSVKPGIRIIKRNELSDKYASIVPPEYRTRPIYAPLSDAEARQFKEDQAQRERDKREARARKKRKDHTE